MKTFIPYGKQCINKADIDEVVKVLKSDWIMQGPKAKEFEDALAEYCGSKYAVVVSSGTAALHLACLAVGFKKNDEAITTPITFSATSNSVIYAGGKPVFADIDYETLNIDLQQIIKKINGKTKAILPVHFAGLPCDMIEIAKIAKKNKLIVIEDACQALGAEYRHQGKWYKVGNGKHSDMTTFSFHPVKSITTGEGGAILTNRKDLYEKLLMLRNHGFTKDHKKFVNNKPSNGPWYHEMQYLGYNYRLTDIQSALGISQLKRLDIFTKRREGIANIYNKSFKDLKDYVDLPFVPSYAKTNWHLYVIKLKAEDGIEVKRRDIFNYLIKNRIGVQVHYIPVYWHPYYKKLGYKKKTCHMAEDCYSRIFSLPLHPSLRKADIQRVINILTESLRELLR